MSVSVVEWLANFGVAGVVLLLLVTGTVVPGFIYKDLQRAHEKQGDALAVERQRNADLQQLAATGVHALDAMREVAEERRQYRGQEEYRMVRQEEARTPVDSGRQGGSS